MDADSSDTPTRASGPHTVISEPTAEQRRKGTIAAFVHHGAEGWTASGSITRTFKGLTIQHLEVDPAAANESITARILREIPIGEILATAAGSDIVIAAVERLLSSQPPEAPAENTSRPGRTPLSDDLLKRIAIAYLAELRAGSGAVKRVAEREGKDTATISRWIFRARQRGWLGQASQGREGAEPGPRLAMIGKGAIAAMIAEAAHQAGDELRLMDGDVGPESE